MYVLYSRCSAKLDYRKVHGYVISIPLLVFEINRTHRVFIAMDFLVGLLN